MSDVPHFVVGPATVIPTVAAALYVAFHYAFSRHALTERFVRQGLPPRAAQARGVIVSKIAGFTILGLGSVLTLALLGLDPLRHGFPAFEPARTVLAAFAPALVFVTVVVLNGRKAETWTAYPEIRDPQWTASIASKSAAAWALYLFGYEYFFRGMLLVSFSDAFGTWEALALTTMFYVAVHLPKDGAETASCILMGYVFGLMAVWSGSFIAPFLLHTLIAVSGENASAIFNPDTQHFAFRPRG